MGVLDVELSNFAKVEELFVKTAPVSLATFADLVCHVVDELETVTELAAIASKRATFRRWPSILMPWAS